MPRAQASPRAYLTDLDGLRAIAILPVLLFHAGVGGFSGGFTGVDVFFVISGFLIVRNLMRDGEQGTFSIWRFYERRVRRIIPALLVVLIAVLIAGFVLIFPIAYEALAKSLMASVLFVSNIWAYQQSGYFTAQENHLPLLHTWSLAVEEQFYLIVPLVIAPLIGRMSRLRTIFAGITVTSFGLSCLGIFIVPVATFYLMPLRAWELCLGSLIAMGLFPAPQRRLARDGLALAGLCLILIGVFALDRFDRFPGAAALLPCVGAAAIIWTAAAGETVASTILSWGPLRLVGLMSYSLYLWHWPVITLTHQYFGTSGLPHQTAFAIALTFIAAFLSWQFVEQPARSRARVSTRHLLWGSGAVAAALLAAGAAVLLAQGAPWRFDRDVNRLAAGAVDQFPLAVRCGGTSAALDDQRCHLGRVGDTQFLFAGDSHAGALAESVGLAADVAGHGGTLSTFAQCPALVDWVPDNPSLADRQGCIRRNQAVFEQIRANPRIQTLIIVAYWANRLRRHPDQIRDGLARTIAFVRAAGKQLIVLHGVPEAEFNVPWALAIAQAHGRSLPLIPRPVSDGQALGLQESWTANLRAIDLGQALCSGNSCWSTVDGAPTFIDTNHLSSHANVRLVAPYLIRTGALF